MYKKYFVLIGLLQVYVKQISRLSSSQGEFAILVPLGYLSKNLPFLHSAAEYLHFWICLFYPRVSLHVKFYSVLSCFFCRSDYAPCLCIKKICFQMKMMVFHAHETPFLYKRKRQSTNVYSVLLSRYITVREGICKRF